MVHITSTLILLAASLLVAGTPVPDAKADLSNAERMKRGMALISPRKLFDATKRDTVASPSTNFSTYRCNHGNTPVCCYFGEVPADDTCFNAISGTGGAPTTDPFTWYVLTHRLSRTGR
ncbi:hypothetical protein RQP46_010807 [Phenoliferia psychrophenolica]